MPLIRPRLTDYYRIPITQSGVDFAIPFLDEDLPLYVDPFLLWHSNSLQENALHTALLNSFNHLGKLLKDGNRSEAKDLLVEMSECDEVGLGDSPTRRGKRIGPKTADAILSLFDDIPAYQNRGFRHFEEIQFFVEGISSDRISDLTCNFLKSYLIDYTVAQSEKFQIPTVQIPLFRFYNYRKNKMVEERDLRLPVNPQTNSPLLLVPKFWLRYKPWLNFDRYFDEFTSDAAKAKIGRSEILLYNRHHVEIVEQFIASREAAAENCKNDPLFTQIPIDSALSCVARIAKLPPGTANKADKKYEGEVCKLLASVLYPSLDFAAEQVRTESGAQIRDLIFYNSQSNSFLNELMDKYRAYQLVFEMKNVASLEREHVNQLARYLKDDFGSFGVFVTRHPAPRNIERNIVDLWAAHRKCLIILTDEDLDLMASLYQSKQRDPLDVVKKKYLEMSRLFPS